MATNTYRILSLSGGGVRGLLAAIWLNRLEQKLGSPLAQHFDLIAGTSTGAVIACGVALGIDTATIVNLYRTQSIDIFPPPIARSFSRLTRVLTQGPDAPRYDGKGLEMVLKSVFGEARFGDLTVRTLITSYDLMRREALIFKTNKLEHQSIPVWEIAKASASAPVYFPAHILTLQGERIPAIDGGVVANNPTACAIAEGVRLNRDRTDQPSLNLPQFVVASFGTGEVIRPISIQQSQEWGALEWAIPLIDVLFDGSADSVDYIAKHLLPDDRYFRFQTRVPPENGDIDNADSENLEALTTIAKNYLATEGDAQIDRLVSALQTS